MNKDNFINKYFLWQISKNPKCIGFIYNIDFNTIFYYEFETNKKEKITFSEYQISKLESEQKITIGIDSFIIL